MCSRTTRRFSPNYHFPISLLSLFPRKHAAPQASRLQQFSPLADTQLDDSCVPLIICFSCLTANRAHCAAKVCVAQSTKRESRRLFNNCVCLLTVPFPLRESRRLFNNCVCVS